MTQKPELRLDLPPDPTNSVKAGHHDRNQRILLLAREGHARRDIAARFHLSVTRIGAIIESAAHLEELEKRSAQLAGNLRNTERITDVWLAQDIIDALSLDTALRNRLIAHFVASNISTMTLLQWMDEIATMPSVSQVNKVKTPLLRIQGIARIGFCRVVEAMNRVGLHGEPLTEWSKRHSLLHQQGF